MKINITNILTVFLVLELILHCSGFKFLIKAIKLQKAIFCLVNHGFSSNNIVLRGDSQNYKNLNYQWNLALPQVYPLGYILPMSEHDVLIAVKCGKKCGIRIVPKCGGHSYLKYSFGDYETLILDTRKMDNINVDKSKEVVTVGPGTLSGKLIYKLWTNGKYFVPTGVCPTVGMAGLSLGGGHGYLTRAYGVTTDSIVEMNVAIANGSLLTVNQYKNQDLFFAMRGAGPSFGIVTKFVFQLRPAPTVFTAIFRYDLEKFVDVFQVWQVVLGELEYSATLHLDVYDNTIEFGMTDAAGTPTIYNKVIKKFPPPRNQLTVVQSYADFSLSIATTSFGKQEANTEFKSFEDFEKVKRTDQIPSYQKFKSFYVSNKLNADATKILFNLFKRQPPNLRALFRPDDGVANRIGATETAFVHRTQLYLLSVLYETSEPNLTKNANSTTWMNEFFNVGKSLFHHNESYQNYLDNELPDYLQRYYGENLPRLQMIKRKYDPHNYFHNPQSIPSI